MDIRKWLEDELQRAKETIRYYHLQHSVRQNPTDFESYYRGRFDAINQMLMNLSIVENWENRSGDKQDMETKS